MSVLFVRHALLLLLLLLVLLCILLHVFVTRSIYFLTWGVSFHRCHDMTRDDHKVAQYRRVTRTTIIIEESNIKSIFRGSGVGKVLVVVL